MCIIEKTLPVCHLWSSKDRYRVYPTSCFVPLSTLCLQTSHICRILNLMSGKTNFHGSDMTALDNVLSRRGPQCHLKKGLPRPMPCNKPIK